MASMDLMDYVDATAHGKQSRNTTHMLAGAYTFFAVALFLFSMRIFTRRFLLRKLQLDDHLLMFAMCMFLAQTITLHGALKGGFLPKDENNNHQRSVRSKLCQYLFEHHYLLALWSTKISLCLLFARVARGVPDIKKWYPKTLYTFMALITAHAITFIVTAIFKCWPVTLVWDTTGNHSLHCVDFTAWNISLNVVNMTTEVIVLLLPTPLLRLLRTGPQKRKGMILVFCLGFIPIAVSITRLVEIIVAARTQHDAVREWFVPNFDQRHYHDPAIWIPLMSTAEVAGGICIACLPTLRPLYRALRTRLLPLTRRHKPVTTLPGARRRHAYINPDDIEMNVLPASVDWGSNNRNTTAPRSPPTAFFSWPRLPRPRQTEVAEAVSMAAPPSATAAPTANIRVPERARAPSSAYSVASSSWERGDEQAVAPSPTSTARLVPARADRARLDTATP